MTPLISATDLVKVYTIYEKEAGLLGALRSLVAPRKRRIRAVDGISLAIEAGEIVACLGPNGAGKSTTIKMLTGILEPTAGRIAIGGLDPLRHRRQVVQRLGVVFGQRSQLNWDLRLGESFELLRRIYRVPPSDYQERLGWLDGVLGIGPLLNQAVRTLSLGQRMRGEMAAALIHGPDILFLDEPTIGLDLEAKQSIRAMIREINRTRGTTILLTSHDLDDVEQLCRRLVVINHGRIVEDGPLAAIVRRLAPHRILAVECESEPTGEIALPGTECIRRDGVHLAFQFDRERVNPAALIRELATLLPIRDLNFHEPDIEEIIQQIYRQPSATTPKS